MLHLEDVKVYPKRNNRIPRKCRHSIKFGDEYLMCLRNQGHNKSHHANGIVNMRGTLKRYHISWDEVKGHAPMT